MIKTFANNEPNFYGGIEERFGLKEEKTREQRRIKRIQDLGDEFNCVLEK